MPLKHENTKSHKNKFELIPKVIEDKNNLVGFCVLEI